MLEIFDWEWNILIIWNHFSWSSGTRPHLNLNNSPLCYMSVLASLHNITVHSHFLCIEHQNVLTCACKSTNLSFTYHLHHGPPTKTSSMNVLIPSGHRYLWGTESKATGPSICPGNVYMGRHQFKTSSQILSILSLVAFDSIAQRSSSMWSK